MVAPSPSKDTIWLQHSINCSNILVPMFSLALFMICIGVFMLHVCHAREVWLEAVKRVFEGLELSSDGTVTAEALVSTLRNKLPADQVDYALEDALLEAGYKSRPHVPA